MIGRDMKQPHVIVDDEFEGLIPPLSKEEYETLERSIVSEGIRDPLVVWAGRDVLVDGHNRLRIARKHGASYKVVEKDFASRLEAKIWIRKNQLGRRNLSDYNRTEVALGLEEDIAARAKENERLSAEQTNAKRSAAKNADKTGLQHVANPSVDYNHTEVALGFEDGIAAKAKEIQQKAAGGHMESHEDDTQCTTNAANSADDAWIVVHNQGDDAGDVRQKPPYEADVPIEVVHVPEKPKIDPIDTRKEVAKIAHVSHEQVRRVKKIRDDAVRPVKDLARNDRISVGMAFNVSKLEPAIQEEFAERVESGESAKDAFREASQLQREEDARRMPDEDAVGTAVLRTESGVGKTVGCDLLLTEAPPKGDEGFVGKWLYKALAGVRETGFAYVIIDNDVDALKAYINAETPGNVFLCQVLTWKFTYLYGNGNRKVYKPDSKHVLFYRGTDAPNLSHLFPEEWTSVHAIDADGGRLDDPRHEYFLPMQLAERFVKHATREGQTVFDPFAKRGTVLLAAKKLGRNAIGYEPDETYASIAFAHGVEQCARSGRDGGSET